MRIAPFSPHRAPGWMRWLWLAIAVLSTVRLSAHALSAERPSLGYHGQRFVLRLQSPPLLRWAQERKHLSAEGRYAYSQQLERAHQQLARALAAALPGSVIEATYRLAFNGVAVRVADANTKAEWILSNLPGVTGVYRDVAFEPNLYASVSMLNLEPLWETAGDPGLAGSGVKIAILDSGIDIDHPMFAPDLPAYPPGYPVGDTRYTTPKVIAARAYFRPTDPPLAGESSPVPGLLGSGHGTQMAGIAAGMPVLATYRGVTQTISGVAPGAWLMNYRIFYPSAQDSVERAYSIEVLRAIEDALRDGADVLCLGWNSTDLRLPLHSPVADALEAAMDAGYVVVAPAGNAGPTYGTIRGVPGGLERVITVGALTKGRIIAYDLADVMSLGAIEPPPPELQGQPFARALFGPLIEERIGPFPYVSVASVPGSGDEYACGSLPTGSLTGRLAIIARGGDCFFADKVYHVQKAGALGAVIYSYDDEPVEMGCAGEYCEPGEITIPAVMVGHSFGTAALAWLQEHSDALLSLDPNARVISSTSHIVPGSSARGPANGRFLKPDLVAPGVDILTSSVANEPMAAPPYDQVSGTSIACAHVAGGAAVLLQLHPDWSHDDIKAALMATASLTPALGSGTPNISATVLDRGAGLVDLAAASQAALVFDPPSIALVNAVPGVTRTFELAARDLRLQGSVRKYVVMGEVDDDLIRLNLPDSVSVRPGERVTVNLQVTIAPDAQPGDYGGEIFFSTESDLVHLPLWVQVREPLPLADVLLIDNDFSNFESYLDYSYYVLQALDDLGLTAVHWDADQHYANPQTIPNIEELGRYDIIIWLTGDNRHPDGYYVLSTPLTSADLEILARYLDGGGRLLAIGQNLAEASDVNPDPDPEWGRAFFYHEYLGAHWLKTSVFAQQESEAQPPQAGPSIVGLVDSFLAGIALHLGPVGDAEGNQVSIDEIALGGLPDGSDLPLVRPLAVALGGYPREAGYVAVAKGSDPTLTAPTPSIPYRTAYYAFGIEGVNDEMGMTTRAELLGRTLDWLRDTVTVTLPSEYIGAPNEILDVTCVATLSLGYDIVGYRWHVQDERANIIKSNTPRISLSMPKVGRYPVLVEARDALGHTAVASTTVVITHGGSSRLVAPNYAAQGGEMEYRVELCNTWGEPLWLTCTLPLPGGVSYVSHSDGTYANGEFVFASHVGTDACVGAGLRVRLLPESAPGKVIVATARFRSAHGSFERSNSTIVLGTLRFPLILKPRN